MRKHLATIWCPSIFAIKFSEELLQLLMSLLNPIIICGVRISFGHLLVHIAHTFVWLSNASAVCIIGSKKYFLFRLDVNC